MRIDPECPVDLHTHTTASDGSLSPEDLVDLARKGGLCAIAVTDHDTTDGVIRAIEAGRRAGVMVIPAVEISSQHKPGSMHILGYFIDTNEPRLQNTLAEMVRNRDRRNLGIVERLNNLGVQITLDEVCGYAGGDVLGRPHFARALVEKGVVSTIQEAFDQYLDAGAAAGVPKEKLPPELVIDMIHGAGGLAVLAHPYQLRLGDGEELESRVRWLCDQGLDGIECYYPEHSEAQTAIYRSLAARYGLVSTGGTDFHGSSKNQSRLGLQPPLQASCVLELATRRARGKPPRF